MFDLIHRVLVWPALHDLYSLQKKIGIIANHLCKSRDGKTPKGVGVDQAPETFDGREKRREYKVRNRKNQRGTIQSQQVQDGYGSEKCETEV